MRVRMRDCMSCWYNLIVHNIIGGLGMASGSHAHPFLRVFGEVPSMPVDPTAEFQTTLTLALEELAKL